MRDFDRAPAPLPPLLYRELVERALREDLGGYGDLTTDAIVAPGRTAQGAVVARADGRVAGLAVAAAVFRALDPGVAIHPAAVDGDPVAAGAVLAVVEGDARALLAAERTALNFLGRLAGVASATARLVEEIADWPARLVCTRKTTPTLRALEKHAVRCGGGFNHRFGLDDGVLVKDNHRALAGGVAAAVEAVRRRLGHMVKVEVEVDTLEQLDEALRCAVDAVLLDNMSPEDLRRAVEVCRGRCLTEASGGIRPGRAAAMAATGVDLLSSGWITQSAPALDVAFDVDLC
jgi:nicotinate-nucleotide pyrophosphorylase (carboxylating)